MKFAVCLSAALLASSLTAPAQAVQVTTVYKSLGGSAWQADLTLVNDDAALVSSANPAGTIAEFTVFFPYATFGSLRSLAAPTAWDPLAVQPDTSPADGYLDYLIDPGTAPLAIGQRAAGFSIGFSYTGTGAPGALRYAVVDPDSFATLYEGRTTAAVAAVPEPTTYALLLLGLGALGWQARRRAGVRTNAVVEAA